MHSNHTQFSIVVLENEIVKLLILLNFEPSWGPSIGSRVTVLTILNLYYIDKLWCNY